jgi:hypothetical protein
VAAEQLGAVQAAWQMFIVPFGAAALGAWFTAHFSLRRFFREKEWERKTQAYTAIFEALFDMRTWFDEHWDAEVKHKELSKERQSELAQNCGAARRTLQRRLTGETWLLPPECSDRLAAMMRQLNKERESFFDELDEGYKTIADTVSDLRTTVRKDLQLEKNAPWATVFDHFESLHKKLARAKMGHGSRISENPHEPPRNSKTLKSKDG